MEKKRIYFQGELLKDTEQGNIFQTDDVEEGPVDSLIEDLNQHTDVLRDEEILEKLTEMLLAEEEALKPYVFYFNNCFVSTFFIADAGKNLLDREIELIRRIMMKVSQKKLVAVKQRRSSKRKTT